MFSISDKAAEKAKEVMAEEGKAGWGLRVYSGGGGCCGPSFGLDLEEAAKAEDDVIEKDGLRVFIDKDTSSKLESMQLDYFQDDAQEGFVLTGGDAPACGSCTSCG
ncbi:MAG TPA: iron-sulfur cluster assembly accessory protein [Dissulfurispiraceae bacterium]|nr:iron-sulfur cluster assembly accessory protein [Dissulfurispiraceae bacterium]